MFGSGMGAGGWGEQSDPRPEYKEPIYEKKEYVPFWEEPKEKGPPPSPSKDTCKHCGMNGIKIKYCTYCGAAF